METAIQGKYSSVNMQISVLMVLALLWGFLPASQAHATEASEVYLDLDSMRLGDVYLPDLLPIVRTKKTPWKEFIANGKNTSREVADQLHDATSFDFGDGLESRMANGWISGIAFRELGFELEVIEVKKVEPSRIRHAATAALKVHLAKSGSIRPFSGTMSWDLTARSGFRDITDSLGDPSQWGISSSGQRQPAFYAHDSMVEGLGRHVISHDDAIEAFETEHQQSRPFVSTLFYERIQGNLNVTFNFSSRGQLQSIEIVPQI